MKIIVQFHPPALNSGGQVELSYGVDIKIVNKNSYDNLSRQCFEIWVKKVKIKLLA